MRYADLLVLLSLIAVGALAWAEPSRRVTVPNSADGAVVLPQSLAQSIRLPKSFASDWEGLDPADFRLTLSVTSRGENLQASHFELEYHGPEGYELEEIYLESATGDWAMRVLDAQQLTSGRWAFSGGNGKAQLRGRAQSYFDEPEPLPLGLMEWGSWRASVLVLDPRPEHFNRGSNRMTLESAPIDRRRI